MERRRLAGVCGLTAIAAMFVSRAAGSAPAQQPQAEGRSIEARVDRLFARWQTPGSPGCSVGVSRGGATVLACGYGQASLELGVPITPESVFHVASVTKPFTAMSILLLARDGRLSIDDDVRRHLLEWAGPQGVTIRHVLTHTSGLREAFLLIEMAAPETGRHGGRRTVGHGGWDPGASAYLVRYPEHDLAVAVLCNLDEIGSIELARGVANLYLGDVTGPAHAAAGEPAAAAMSSADLAANEGLYRDPTDETLLRIFLRDGTLRGSPGAGADGGWPIVPLGANRFQIPTTPILEFDGGASGARTLRIVGERPTPAVLERVASYVPSAADLAGVAGDYRSEELSTTYALRVRDGALVADVPVARRSRWRRFARTPSPARSSAPSPSPAIATAA